MRFSAPLFLLLITAIACSDSDLVEEPIEVATLEETGVVLYDGTKLSPTPSPSARALHAFLVSEGTTAKAKLDGVRFVEGTSELDLVASAVHLQDMAKLLLAYPTVELTVVSGMPNGVEKSVAQARCQVVANELITLGIKPERVSMALESASTESLGVELKR